MPKRTDLRSILIVGSGPIRIGQGCEFDYAGVQACRALARRGLPGRARELEPGDDHDRPRVGRRHLPRAARRADARRDHRPRAARRVPPHARRADGAEPRRRAVRERRAGGVRGRADRREPRRDSHRRGPLAVPRGDGGRRAAVPASVVVTSVDELDDCPVPAVVRPAFTLGGGGGGLARTHEELYERVAHGLAASPIGQVLVERSLEGWQEFELEVMADTAGNCVVICSIENLDPVGVHTGDSWTVAPQQTLSDGELQRLRDAAFACARAVGVATGGANVQFAYEPETRELALIEMNPRVSRSSALASKATGFPIAKLAALLAVGYTLDELPNDITGASSAAFEPALDYVAVEGAALRLRPLPRRRPHPRHRDARGRRGARARPHVPRGAAEGARGSRGRRRAAGDPGPASLLRGRARVDPRRRARARRERRRSRGEALRASRRAHRRILGVSEADVRARRGSPGRLAVDSCAGEFEAQTPYYYLSYEESDGNGTRAGLDRRARLRHEPDRPGDRVRLLLRARHAGVPPARARGRARELESGDGLDRLRHLRPPLPRAGDARARARRGRAGAAARRRRLARRADAARPRGRAGGGGRAAARRPAARDRGGRGSRAVRSAPRQPRRSRARVGPRGARPAAPVRSRTRSATPCSCGRPTSSAAAECWSRASRPSWWSTGRR